MNCFAKLTGVLAAATMFLCSTVQAALPADCDQTLSGQYTFPAFQAILDQVTDVNYDSLFKICFTSGASVTNAPGSTAQRLSISKNGTVLYAEYQASITNQRTDGSLWDQTALYINQKNNVSLSNIAFTVLGTYGSSLFINNSSIKLLDTLIMRNTGYYGLRIESTDPANYVSSIGLMRNTLVVSSGGYAMTSVRAAKIDDIQNCAFGVGNGYSAILSSTQIGSITGSYFTGPYGLYLYSNSRIGEFSDSTIEASGSNLLYLYDSRIALMSRLNFNNLGTTHRGLYFYNSQVGGIHKVNLTGPAAPSANALSGYGGSIGHIDQFNHNGLCGKVAITNATFAEPYVCSR